MFLVLPLILWDWNNFEWYDSDGLKPPARILSSTICHSSYWSYMKLPKLAKETPVNNGISTTNLKWWVYWISGCHLSRMLVLWEGTSQTWGFHQPDAAKHDGRKFQGKPNFSEILLPEREKITVGFFSGEKQLLKMFMRVAYIFKVSTPIHVNESMGFGWGVRETERWYSWLELSPKNGWTFTPSEISCQDVPMKSHEATTLWLEGTTYTY